MVTAPTTFLAVRRKDPQFEWCAQCATFRPAGGVGICGWLPTTSRCSCGGPLARALRKAHR